MASVDKLGSKATSTEESKDIFENGDFEACALPVIQIVN
jgi:hypothetical protein